MAIPLCTWAWPLVARADPTCAYNGTSHTATITPDPSQNTIPVIRSGTAIYVGGQDCGGVNNLDTMTFEMGNSHATLTFDLSGGAFAPGFTDEGDGSSEVEFQINTISSTGARVRVEGSSGNDHVDFGTHFVLGSGTVNDVNLNAAEASPDIDVSIYGGVYVYGIDTKQGNDVVSGAGTGAFLSDGAFASISFTPGPGQDTIEGGYGGDFFYGEDTADEPDSYSGGSGFDFLNYADRTVGVRVVLNGQPDDGSSCPGAGCEGDNVAADIESVSTGSGSDRLIGAAGTQRFSAGEGNNHLEGRGGNDSLFAESGTDDLLGGKGSDTAQSYYFGVSPHPGLEVTLDGKANDGLDGEKDNVDVEGFIGSAGPDLIIGNEKANELAGEGGNDVLRGAGGKDFLNGGYAHPSVGDTYSGNDKIFGGAGVDTGAMSTPLPVSGETAGATIKLDDKANDQTIGHPEWGVDNIHSDVENLIGSGLADNLRGSDEANRLAGGEGGDILIGLDGNDILVPGGGSDGVIGGPGNDTASFEDSDSPIIADVAGDSTGDGADALGSIERLIGSAFGDKLTGDGGPNVLTGLKGADILKGLVGDDRLFGGDGGDTLNGGAGTDRCAQGPGNGSENGCEN